MTRIDSNVSGFLLVDKPHGITSFDVVASCRRLFETKKVGHSGTLDPFATGLLIVAFGEALKLLEFLPASPKVYTGDGVFGATSDTLDREGTITQQCNDETVREKVSRELIEKTIYQNLLGKISQTPPKYSAIKIDGVSAHYRARRGEEVIMKARATEVFSFDIPSFDSPNFTFECSVSSGTYVRSLIDTLGSLLGVGAFVGSLRRESIGPFSVADAHTAEELSRPDARVTDFLLPLEAGVSELVRIDISHDENRRLSNGLEIALPSDIDLAQDVYAAFLDSQCVGILEVSRNNALKFRKLLHRT